jgi:hypothetical protein
MPFGWLKWRIYVIGLSMLMEVQQYSIGRDSIPRGRMAKMVEAKDRFICEGVLKEGYLASELADFLGCYPSNVSRAVQKALAN